MITDSEYNCDTCGRVLESAFYFRDLNKPWFYTADPAVPFGAGDYSDEQECSPCHRKRLEQDGGTAGAARETKP